MTGSVILTVAKKVVRKSTGGTEGPNSQALKDFRGPLTAKRDSVPCKGAKAREQLVRVFAASRQGRHGGSFATSSTRTGTLPLLSATTANCTSRRKVRPRRPFPGRQGQACPLTGHDLDAQSRFGQVGFVRRGPVSAVL